MKWIPAGEQEVERLLSGGLDLDHRSTELIRHQVQDEMLPVLYLDPRVHPNWL
jgi:hypothetical protein